MKAIVNFLSPLEFGAESVGATLLITFAQGRDGTPGKSAYQLAVEGGFIGTEAQFYYDLAGVQDLVTFETLEQTVDGQAVQIATLEGIAAQNTSDIQGIKEDQERENHYRGDYRTNTEIQALTDNRQGDFAYSVESGTRWAYNTAWQDTGEEWVDTPIPASDALPLVDGAPAAGIGTSYSRGDHRHPTDLSRASVADMALRALRPVNKVATLLPEQWSGAPGDYTYLVADADIVDGAFVPVTILNDSVDIASAVELLPMPDYMAGVGMSIHAKNLPTVSINLSYTIIS